MSDRERLMPWPRVAIGFAGTNRDDILPGAPGWSTWVHPCMGPRIEQMGYHADAVTAWFDMHREEIWRQPKPWRDEYPAWLAARQAPIVMQEAWEDIPASVAYPRAAIAAAFPGAPFHGTFDWMMALAIHWGATDILCHGAGYTSAHEFHFQRPAAWYWIGVARGRGIAVRPGVLMEAPNPRGEYGYDYPPWPRGMHPHGRTWTRMPCCRDFNRYRGGKR